MERRGGVPLIPRLVHRVWFDLGNGPDPPEHAYGSMRDSFDQHHRMEEPQWPPAGMSHAISASDAVNIAERMARDADIERTDPGRGWRIIQWTKPMADEFVARYHVWFLPYWHTYKEPIFQIDAIRYMVLCTLGGIYLDQDIALHRSLDDMLFDAPDSTLQPSALSAPSSPTPTRSETLLGNTAAPHRSPREVVLVECQRVGIRGINNYVVASRRGHPFMEHLVRELYYAHQSVFHCKASFVGTMRVAGPLFLERAFAIYQSLASPSSMGYADYYYYRERSPSNQDQYLQTQRVQDRLDPHFYANDTINNNSNNNNAGNDDSNNDGRINVITIGNRDGYPSTAHDDDLTNNTNLDGHRQSHINSSRVPSPMCGDALFGTGPEPTSMLASEISPLQLSSSPLPRPSPALLALSCSGIAVIPPHSFLPHLRAAKSRLTAIKEFFGSYRAPLLTNPLYDFGYGVHVFHKSWGCAKKVLCDLFRAFALIVVVCLLAIVAWVSRRAHLCALKNAMKSVAHSSPDATTATATAGALVPVTNTAAGVNTAITAKSVTT